MHKMCRCCQRCFEDIYWNCIEERFCYDESIANYNPDEDDEYLTKKNGIITTFQRTDNNNTPVCIQPSRRDCYTISSKIHEEDYRREIQTNIQMIAPEILAVFANSQIFADHQPKLPRNKTKSDLPEIHISGSNNIEKLNKSEINDEKLLKKLESFSSFDYNNYENSNTTITSTANTDSSVSNASDKKIKFTISPESDSPVELRRSVSPQKFSAIIEENSSDDDSLKDGNSSTANSSLKTIKNLNVNTLDRNYVEKKPLRSVQSVPYFTYRQASNNDIFSISGSLGQISMTPEVPSISYTNLPKNYLDTPTVNKYQESVSLYSIQTANKAKALEEDYSMPRYFRMPTIVTAQSTGNLSNLSGATPSPSGSRTDIMAGKKVEKSKRLKLLRTSLPPLLIHTVRHQKNKDDPKHVS